MVFLANAFSLQMLEGDNVLITQVLDLDRVKKILSKEGFISAVGHQDTSAVLSDILGLDIPCNRINIKLGEDDTLIVAQLVGGRLPEGSTTLPDGFSFQFVAVQLSNKSCPFPFCQ